MATSAAPHNHPIFMRGMMEHLGIDPGAHMAAQWTLSYMTALHRCQDCAHTQECRAWLAGMPDAVALPPRFCPNADIFFEMQVDQPGPHYSDRVARIPTRAA